MLMSIQLLSPGTDEVLTWLLSLDILTLLVEGSDADFVWILVSMFCIHFLLCFLIIIVTLNQIIKICCHTLHAF